MPLACDRVMTCCVRAFTLLPETPWSFFDYFMKPDLKEEAKVETKRIIILESLLTFILTLTL